MNSEEIQKSIHTFQSGGICIFPTDTAFGIGCRLDREDSVKRLFQIRRRPETKPMLALVSSVEMAKKYVTISDEVQTQLIAKYWPGALTIIVPCDTEKVPGIVRANGSTLAMRMPDHEVLRKIIQEVGVPILAPSANFSGEKTSLSLEEIDKNLIEQVDFVLPGECTLKGVSTLIDCSKKPWKVVREGIVQLRV